MPTRARLRTFAIRGGVGLSVKNGFLSVSEEETELLAEQDQLVACGSDIPSRS